MSSFFKAFAPGTIPEADSASTEKLVNSELDDIEIPEGAEMPSPAEMKAAIEQANVHEASPSSTSAQPDQVSEEPLQSPTTPRPVAHTMSSHTDIAQGDSQEESESVGEDVDPNDDVLSMNTDINLQGRQIDKIWQALSNIQKKLESLPSLDSRLRKVATEQETISQDMVAIRTDMTNMKTSFNTYQSMTANKIADVERKAATKQLSVEAVAEPSLVPPETVSMERDIVPEYDNQAKSVSKIPVAEDTRKAGKAKATIVNMDDW